MTLTPRRKRIGKKLARWGSSSAVGECLEDPDIRQEVVTALGDMVEKELKQLCSKKVNSIQRTTSAETIKQFNWSSIITEARVHAPILLQLLSTLSAKKSRKKKPDKSHSSVIGVLLCVLCKHRNPSMMLFQRVLSLILYAGHSAKQVKSIVLADPHLSDKLIIRCIRDLGSSFSVHRIVTC